MNGHSTAETLGFSMEDIARRWPRVGDRTDAPVFLFAAGWGSREKDIARRIPGMMADQELFNQAIIDMLAAQIVRAAHTSAGMSALVTPPKNSDNARLERLVLAHAAFFRNSCKSQFEQHSSERWGMISVALTGDHATYLRALFPRAKFLFAHRDPIRAFTAALSKVEPSEACERDNTWVESFVEEWCRLVAGFEMWSTRVGGIMVDADAAADGGSAALDEYLGERLSPPTSDGDGCIRDDSYIQLRDDEVRFINARAASAAARFGYILTEDAPTAGEAEHRPLAPTLHTETARISCAVLVPAVRYIEPECDEALWELERRGYSVLRVRGCSPIDHARSRLATMSLEQGFDETMWIDADTEFDPDDVDRLRSHGLPIVAGVCARRQPGGGLAVSPIPGAREIIMGEDGGLVEVLYAGTGFLFIRMEVYVGIQERFNLPLCDEDGPGKAIPFFMPMLEHWGGKMSYLAEDYALSRRARLCGYKIMADTSIRLWHIGMYRYGFEDAGSSIERVTTYRHLFDREKNRR